MASRAPNTSKITESSFDAADELYITPPHMMGCLCPSAGALDNAPGRPRWYHPRMTSGGMEWDAAWKPAATLIRAGWIDGIEDGTLEIHDWYGVRWR